MLARLNRLPQIDHKLLELDVMFKTHEFFISVTKPHSRMKSFLICLLLFSLSFLFLAPSAFSKTDQLFPRSPAIDVQVYFWKQVFSQVSVREGVLHDKAMVLPIYEKVSLAGLSKQKAKQKIKARKQHVRQQLLHLADAIATKRPLQREQKKLLALFYKGITPRELRRSANRIRMQRGLVEEFKKGLARSGAYMPHIHRVLKRYQLPLQLAYLPHVESSFNYVSHSKSGAKGIWQFTKGTGRDYMRVNSYVDERIDPFISTDAAARLLKSNYKKLGTWPLALTAYNHGPYGMQKIVKKLGTKDLGYIIQHYVSKRFNFASKNFYAEFLAAWEVAENYQQYFGPIQFHQPWQFREIRLAKPAHMHTIARRLNVTRDQLLAYNPALQRSVIQGWRPIPSYYRVKIPLDSRVALKHPSSKAPSKTFQTKARNQINSKTTRRSQQTPRWVTVKKGDSLSAIAQRFGLSTQRLAGMNNLRMHQVLYPGKVLRLPSLHQQEYAIVRKGESLTAISRRTGVSVSQLIRNNALTSSTIHPGQRLKLTSVPSQTSRVVVVKKGDSLSAIARRNGIRLNELIAANGLSKDSVIYPGQRLLLNL